MSQPLLLVPRTGETDTEKIIRLSLNSFRSELGDEAASLFRRALLGIFLQGALQFALGPFSFAYTAASAADLLFRVMGKTYRAYQTDSLQLGCEYCVYKKDSLLIAEKTRDSDINTISVPEYLTWELAPQQEILGVNQLSDFQTPYSQYIYYQGEAFQPQSLQNDPSSVFVQNSWLDNTYHNPIVFDAEFDIQNSPLLHSSFHNTQQEFDFDTIYPHLVTFEDHYQPTQPTIDPSVWLQQTDNDIPFIPDIQPIQPTIDPNAWLSQTDNDIPFIPDIQPIQPTIDLSVWVQQTDNDIPFIPDIQPIQPTIDPSAWLSQTDNDIPIIPDIQPIQPTIDPSVWLQHTDNDTPIIPDIQPIQPTIDPNVWLSGNESINDYNPNPDFGYQTNSSSNKNKSMVDKLIEFLQDLFG
jgi:hypothetical protein